MEIFLKIRKIFSIEELIINERKNNHH